MYRRSLLVLRALTDRRVGAAAAGARDGWAYVWPRDAGAAALAFAAAGYGEEAKRITSFLRRVDLSAAARFDGHGLPVPGRDGQGDAAGWAAVAALAARFPPAPMVPCAERRDAAVRSGASASSRCAARWRDRADYWEGEPGDYLGNAIAAAGAGVRSGTRPGGIATRFGTDRGLAREAGDPDSGLDSAAAWAVRPFRVEPLYPRARATLRRLAAQRSSRFGITPGETWEGSDPWSAPTAWSAWALAALAREADRPQRDRRAALELLAALRRSATPAGALPERVDARRGVPRSTTPLAWSHAFAILALRELW